MVLEKSLFAECSVVWGDQVRDLGGRDFWMEAN